MADFKHTDPGDSQAETKLKTEKRDQVLEGLAASETIVANLQFQADSARRLGNSASYRFYADAVGWPSLIAFVVAMFMYAFCSAFPSKSYDTYTVISIVTHSW